MQQQVRVAAGSGVGPDAHEALDAALLSVEAGLAGAAADLVMIFVGSGYVDAFEFLAERVRSRLAPARLVGATAVGVVSDAAELERPDTLSLWAAALPGAEVTTLRYTSPSDALPAEWPAPPASTRALVLLADPLSFAADPFLTWMGHNLPGVPICGGLASGSRELGGNRLLMDGEVFGSGAVAVALAGDIRVRSAVSQGCRPIGRTYVVTEAERNLIHSLGGEPPMDRIKEMFTGADSSDRRLLRGGLHIGTAVDEYRDDFGRGDFLVRAVLGAQAGTGALAVGDVVQIGQTVQFHVRDAASADEDLHEQLKRLQAGAADGVAAGALLFTCNGRGQRLFGEPDHDAGAVRDVLGDIAVAGFFCAGEFGPVGPRSFLHGFTASLLVVDQR